MVELTQDMIDEIERIVGRGNTAEVVKLKHEVVLFEKTTQKKTTAPVEVRE